MHSPQRSHYQAALRVLRYLKGTVGLGLTFKKSGKLDLLIYTDSDFGGSLIDRRSTTEYCTMLGGNLVTSKSKKQSVVSKSSTEAEFRTLSSGVDEVLWIRGILKDLKIPYEEPIHALCDNKSAILFAHDPVNHNRTKHIDIDRFYIKEKLEEKVLHRLCPNYRVMCRHTNQRTASQAIFKAHIQARNEKHPFPCLRGSVEKIGSLHSYH